MKKALILLACIPLLLCGCSDVTASVTADDIPAAAEQEAVKFDSSIVYACADDANDTDESKNEGEL